MSDLKNILQEEYKKKKRLISPQSIMLMIEGLMDDIQASMVEEVIVEGAQSKVRTYHISEIPMIPISELGWANADDNPTTDDPNIPTFPAQDLKINLTQFLTL